MKNRTGRVLVALVGVLLVAGSILTLQATTAHAADERVTGQQGPATQWNDCVYIVRYGDTLFRIGLRYGVSPYYLAQINGLWNPNYIFAGMRLRVPCYGNYPPKYPPYQPTRPFPCVEKTTYVVRPGDNLFRIALNFGTTVEALRDANDLWGKVLRPGSTLIIPCPVRVPENHATVPEATVQSQAAPNAQGTPPAPPAPNAQGTPVAPPAPNAQATSVPNAQGTPVVPPAPNAQATLAPEPSANITLGEKVDPTVTEIKAGQSVVFINNTNAAATVLSGFPGNPNGVFTSGVMPVGGTWIYVFDTVGSYTFYVMENPGLAGQVNVAP